MAKLNAVEIFSAGVWNDREYTDADLEQIVANFPGVDSVPLVVGHDSDIMKDSGAPRFGTITHIYLEEGKIKADIDDVAPDLAKLIRQKSYTDVSCEMVELNNGLHLSAVAMLGAKMPAVKNLKDIPSVTFSAQQRNVERDLITFVDQGKVLPKELKNIITFAQGLNASSYHAYLSTLADRTPVIHFTEKVANTAKDDATATIEDYYRANEIQLKALGTTKEKLLAGDRKATAERILKGTI